MKVRKTSKTAPNYSVQQAAAARGFVGIRSREKAASAADACVVLTRFSAE
jgi:hypothetical protein